MTREEQIYEAADKATYQTPPQYSELVHKSRKVMCAFEVGFIDGCVWADSHPRWIPVEERLPEETEVVLGVREGGTDVEMYKFMGFNESTNTLDWEWHPYYRAVVDDVTHWMPIVPPRKEE